MLLKFEVSNFKNKKISATITFPEGLENTHFTKELHSYAW